MNPSTRRARRVALPPEVRVAKLYDGAFLADAYAIALPPAVTRDAAALARFVFERPAPWVDGLMALRDRLVAGFGLKTAAALRADAAPHTPRVGIFRIYETHADEVVLGEDDRHLDFRLSVYRPDVPAGSAGELMIVTVVHCHRLLGRNYIRLITPFHRLVVRSTLNRAARAGWPANPLAATAGPPHSGGPGG